MASVTQRITKVQQPYGGYLSMKLFSKRQFDDGCYLNESENIHPSLVGSAVDYLTRFLMGESIDNAFRISVVGAYKVEMEDTAEFLKTLVTGLNDISIIAACRLAGFDVCYRDSKTAYKPVEDITPDKDTIANIAIMVKRSLSFFEKYGPVVCSGPTFEGGYTETVNSGDGDFVSEDTLWDFKVSKSTPTTKHTLQLLMYYIMGIHSVHDYFKSITNIGIFNPRLNVSYTCPVSAISESVIAQVEKYVICYDEPVATNSRIATLLESDDSVDNDYTLKDICSMSGYSERSVYSDIKIGRLVAYKKDGTYYVSPTEYTNYLERKKRKKEALVCVGAVAMVLCLLGLVLIFK